MIKPRVCFPDTKEGLEEYIEQCDEELGNNGKELKDYPNEDYGCDIQHERAERNSGAR